MLRESIDAGTCIVQTKFGSTARILSQLCGRRINANAVSNKLINGPEVGETVLHTRIAPTSTKEERREGIGAVDLEFYLIDREQ